MDFEERVPGDHPIGSIKALARSALERLSPEFDPMYPKVGRASVPPGRLLKASLLIPLYPAVSERSAMNSSTGCRSSLSRKLGCW